MKTARYFMKRVFIPSIAMLILSGCYHAGINTAGNYCNSIGLHQGQSAYWDCVNAVTKNQPYVRDKDAEIAEEKQQKAVQLAADSSQCKEYGFKVHTPDFANCMLQLDQARNQNQLAESQQNLMRQQMIQQKKWQDYQASEQFKRDMQANQPVHCYGSIVGHQTNTTCY